VNGEGIEHTRQPIFDALAFEYSASGSDGRPDLGMAVYNLGKRCGGDLLRGARSL
jgi:hypothetical protein